MSVSVAKAYCQMSMRTAIGPAGEKIYWPAASYQKKQKTPSQPGSFAKPPNQFDAVKIIYTAKCKVTLGLKCKARSVLCFVVANTRALLLIFGG